ncbi:MAG: SpoIIE family protein phosphatase [Oscillospiraceae bacterium]|nr:SpoIIE family protein phosphatase [Oscillospiraceae bacterium]
MNIRAKILELRRRLVSGEMFSDGTQAAQIACWALNLLLGLATSCASLLGQYGPFGVAATAQAGAEISGLCCALGACVGYLVHFGFERGIKYVAAVVLVFTVSYVSRDIRLCRRGWFMPLCASCFMLLTGILSAVDSGGEALAVLTETILAGGCTWFFREALDGRPRDTESAELRRGISLVILAAVLLMAVSGAELFGVVSLGRVVCLLLVMTAAFKGGALPGAAAGTALGVAMDIARGGAPVLSVCYALGGLVSGVFSRHGRLWFLLSFILAGAAAVFGIRLEEMQISALYETFAASVIFLILPNSALGYIGSFLRSSAVSSGESGLRRYTAQRVRLMSEAFREMYDTVDKSLGSEQNDADPAKIFDRAADSVCAHCKYKSRCWTAEYMDTFSVFNDLTPAINERGSVAESDFPDYFLEKCVRAGELVNAVNGELRARMYRRRFRARLEENRSAAYSQYLHLSEILSEVSEELSNSYGPDLLAQRRLVRFLNGIDIDADVSAFRDRSGRLRIILESARLGLLSRESGWLDRLSGVVGVRLCREKDSSEAEGRMVLLEAEPLAVSVGIASVRKKGESVSGDRGTWFKTGQGLLCIILSDGMGSGPEAARESAAAVRILERFLRCGVDGALAMRLLNSLMLLKSGDEWGFATADLMCIDLFTGEAGFYKYGAAPSYVRTGRSVRRVRSETLAAGLASGEKNPDTVTMRLKPGSLALIASDGVIAESDDGWLRSMLMASDGADVRRLARDTLEAAVTKYGCGDDMTVLTVRVEERK